MWYYVRLVGIIFAYGTREENIMATRGSKMRGATKVEEYARRLKENGVTWIEYCNALFGFCGFVSETFPTGSALVAFSTTQQFKNILGIMDELQQRDEAAEAI